MNAATPGRTRLLGTALAVVTALGCASSPPPAPKDPEPCKDPEPLSVFVDGAADLNRGPSGQPLPTVVKVYQLKGTTRLAVVSLDEVMRNEKAALGDDLLEAQQLTLKPGARVYPELRRAKDASHLAVAALYREPTAESWRNMVALPPTDPFHCHKKSEKPRWMQFFLHGYSVDFVPNRS
jgi:type VI secretion system VasD/TssJ family lipoprotein